jgi:hypothetical protein
MGRLNPTDIPLIIFVKVSVKKVFAQGRDFRWPRPDRCPRCGGRIWGHGFVPAYFDGIDQVLWVRRYRCPDCRTVFRLRPDGYWKRFQASIAAIRERLAHRLNHSKWIPDLPRSRQRHWLRALRRKVCACLGQGWCDRLLEGFDSLILRGEIPVSRSI